MIELRLTLGKTLYVCDICGETSEQADGLEDCKKAQTAVRTTELSEGDVVHIHRYRWQTEDLRPHAYTVRRIFYSKPDEELMGFNLLSTYPEAHTLCLELAQSWDGGKDRAWRPGDHSISSAEVTMEGYLLWKNGDIEELRKAGLVMPPRKKSLWERLFNRL